MRGGEIKVPHSSLLSQLPNPIYLPTKQVLGILSHREWVCCYSGGKDSTALVTWVEWLRRVRLLGRDISKLVGMSTPRLVMSDTTIEYPFLRDTSTSLLGVLATCGWQYKIVVPEVRHKMYNQIFGRGVTPIDRAVRGMRWCTRATKTDPMQKWAEREIGAQVVQLTGARWGESQRRDEKLRRSIGGCAAGGECGLPVPRESEDAIRGSAEQEGSEIQSQSISRKIISGKGRTRMRKGGGGLVYAPIINWKTCNVIDWLAARAGGSVAECIVDLLGPMTSLLNIYGYRDRDSGRVYREEEVTARRFGCVGCPAIRIGGGKRSIENTAPEMLPGLKKLYSLLEECRDPVNRLAKVRPPTRYTRDARYVVGPMTMKARQRLYEKFINIQRELGIELVTRLDIKYIHYCWRKKIYPRGWSVSDESI